MERDIFINHLLLFNRVAIDREILALKETTPPLEIIDHLIAPSLESIGRGWEEGRLALSQVYMAGRLCEDLVERLLTTTSTESLLPNQPGIAIVTLLDSHTLGKKTVCSFLRASGYAIRDFGGGVTVEELVTSTIQAGVKLLLISALMLPSALRIAQVRQGLDESGGSGIKIIVGGAPFNCDRQLWREVRSDAVGYNAGEAINLVGYLRE